MIFSRCQEQRILSRIARIFADTAWRLSRIFASGTFAVLAVAALSACSTRGGPIAYDPPGFGVADTATEGSMAVDLPLGPLDTVRITVFRVADLSGEYQVSVDGFIDMPLIGRVVARDRTPTQLAESLEQTYAQRYLNNPDVSVRVLTSTQRNVTLEGGVRDPGQYQIAGQTTLIRAIALAKGIDPENGNGRRVAIFRKIEGKPMAAAFDLVDIRRGKMQDPIVYPGDTIVVDGNGLRSAYRDLLQSLPILAIFARI